MWLPLLRDEIAIKSLLNPDICPPIPDTSSAPIPGSIDPRVPSNDKIIDNYGLATFFKYSICSSEKYRPNSADI
jgi:hypothetical protein